MTSPYDDAPMRYQEDRTQFELCRACGAYDAPDVTGHCNLLRSVAPVHLASLLTFGNTNQ
jgi:hypothetical protein